MSGDQCVLMAELSRAHQGRVTRGCLPSSPFMLVDGDESDSGMSLMTEQLPRD